jgi:hypothetical protein
VTTTPKGGPSSPPKTALVVGSGAQVAAAVAKVLPAWKIAGAIKNRSALEMLKNRPYDLVLTGEELIYGEKGNEVVLIKYLKPEQLET